MGDAGDRDVIDVVARLGAAQVDVRREAAAALARLGEGAAPAAAALVRACGDEDGEVREQAVAALEDLGPPPADATGQLVDMATSEKPLVAYWAVTLLGRAGQGAAIAVPVLVRCLGSTTEMSVRQRSAWALGQIGPAAVAARDALGQAAGDTDPRLARLAAEALEAIGR